MNLHERYNLVLPALKNAGEMAMSFSRKLDLEIEQKGNNLGPVTEADQAVSEYLMAEFKAFFPNDLLISEEAPPPAESGQKFAWLIDPIDGTKEFIKRNGQWSIMVGLLDENRQPIMGFVYEAEAGTLYSAIKGEGSFRVNLTSQQPPQRLSCNTNIPASEATLLQSLSHSSDAAERIAPELGINRIMHQGSLGLKLARIAENRAQLYFNFSRRTHLWDLCAGEVILREAGGFVGHPNEQPVEYSLEQLVIKEPFLATAGGPLTAKACHQARLHFDEIN